MSRPRAFDADDVLDRAVDIFWRRGYAATSVSDLVSELGINRGTLYTAFDSKDELYRRALERYRDNTIHWLRQALADQTVPLRDRLRAVLLTAAQSGDHRGCLVVNTATERNHDSPDMLAVTTEIAHSIRGIVAAAVQSAADRGGAGNDLVPRLTAGAATDLIVTVLQGVRVMATLDGGFEVSRAGVEALLSAVFAAEPSPGSTVD